jgi:hypothetical protein
MKRFAFLVASFLILICFLACASHEAKIQESGAKILSQSDLENMFSKEIKFRWVGSKTNGITIYKPDGTAEAEGRGFTNTGQYWIEDGQYCSKWDKYRTSVKCWRWYQINDKKYHQVDSNGKLVVKMYIED